MDRLKSVFFNKRIFVETFILVLIYLYMLNPIFLHVFDAYKLRLNLLLLVWGLCIIAKDFFQKNLFRKTTNHWVVYYLIWAAIATLFHPKTFDLVEIHKYLALVVFVFVFERCCFESTKEEMTKSMVHIGMYVITIVTIFNVINFILLAMFKNGQVDQIYKYFYSAFTEPLEYPRGILMMNYYGIYEHNIMAGFRCYTAMLFALYMVDVKAIKKWVAGVVWLSCLAMVSVLNSRNVLIIIAFIICVFAYMNLRRTISKEKAKRITRCILIVFAVFFVILVGSYIRELKMLHPDDSMYKLFNRFTSSRADYWAGAWNSFTLRPILGWGYANNGPVGSYQAGLDNFHNLIMNLLAWTGIVGCILFVTYVVKAIQRIYANKEIIKENHAIYLVVFVACMFIQTSLDIGILGVFNRLETAIFWYVFGYLEYIDVCLKTSKH